jgi:intein-encoded DNA endonuclease-like protein
MSEYDLPAMTPVLPADVRLRLYQETMEMRATHGWGYRRISRALSVSHGIDVPRGTIQNWVLGNHNPSRRLHRYFEPAPCPELSYVVGIVLGDGYTAKDQGRGIVGLTNKDRHLLDHFLLCIARVLDCPSAGRITKGTRYGTLKATVGSTLLMLFLQKPLRQLAPLIEKHPAHFIRGFFDAEGCAVVTTSGDRLRIGVKASNSDIELLQYVSRLLRERFGIASSINVERRPWQTTIRGQVVEFRKTVFRLRVNKFSHVEIFAREIGFSSAHKREILEDALAILEKVRGKKAVDYWLRDHMKAGFRWSRIEAN